MMVKDHVSERFEYSSPNIIMAPGRVFLHDLPFSFRQRMSFIEYLVLDKELADVVEHSRHVRLSSRETEIIFGTSHDIPCNLGG